MANRPANQRCGNCKFHIDSECHFEAPHPVATAVEVQAQPNAAWLVTADSDWCNRWKSE